jgi:hypothetical protein
MKMAKTWLEGLNPTTAGEMLGEFEGMTLEEVVEKLEDYGLTLDEDFTIDYLDDIQIGGYWSDDCYEIEFGYETKKVEAWGWRGAWE